MTDKDNDLKTKAEALMDRADRKVAEAQLHLKANTKGLSNNAKDAAHKLESGAKDATDKAKDKVKDLFGGKG